MIEDMWRMIEEDETDDVTKLALADMLEEAGEDYVAEALRWCVKNGKWPTQGVYTDTRFWYWSDEEGENDPGLTNMLLMGYRWGNGNLATLETVIGELAGVWKMFDQMREGDDGVFRGPVIRS